MTEQALAASEPALGRLTPREIRIFTARRQTKPPETYQVLADEFGVTRERIRQIEVKASRKLEMSDDEYAQFEAERAEAMAKNEPVTKRRETTEELFPVRLIRNYVPRGDFEVVGYHKEAVTVKDATGRWYEVEPAMFMHGERKPHPSPGVGFDNKLWAGTYIAVSRDEARDMIAKKIAERADDV